MKELLRVLPAVCALVPSMLLPSQCSTAFAQDVARSNALAIVGARIIDGTTVAAIEEGVILVRGDRIESVGRDLAVPEDAHVIDAEGLTAMPGLADMHVHLAAGQSENGRDVLGYQSRLNSLLYAGVTTVLDLGNFLPFVAQMRQEIDAGRLAGPQIYYVGPLIESADPTWPSIARSMTSSAQALQIASQLRSHGAEALKAYGSLSSPQVRSLVRAARQESLPVIVDLWVRNGAEHLLTSGIRAFAHTPGRVTAETIATIKEREIFIITTHAGTEAQLRLRRPGYLGHPLIADIARRETLVALREWAASEPTDDERETLEFKSSYVERVQRNAKALWDAGVPLVAGTDGTTTGLFLGEGLHRELELLVDAGLTPLEAIASATGNAARLLADEDEWGTIRAGRRADILLVRGRPDLDISTTRNIETVIQRGRIVDRESLRIDAAADPGFRDFAPGPSR